MITIICLIGSILCFTYVGLLLINPDKFVNLFPPYSKNEVKRKQCCWVNGEEIEIK